MSTLDEALTLGQGVERPFRCAEHDDTTASASVNMLKGLWYCYACHAYGSIGNVKAPSVSALTAMIEPETAGRCYPESWLELFAPPVSPAADHTYWATRFPAWLRWLFGLGEDPVTGDATFPVRTPQGVLAGVGRRRVDPDVQPRYLYPPRWSASRSMFGWPIQPKLRGDVLVLVEGAADAVAVAELGLPALACYGAGLHLPQRELVARAAPRLVLLGFDTDAAGVRATETTIRLLGDLVPSQWVAWPKKDPADCAVSERLAAIVDAVRVARYRGPATDHHWTNMVAGLQLLHRRHLEENA